jgi:predicted nucleic-acid-binding Zn-ribbon protein
MTKPVEQACPKCAGTRVEARPLPIGVSTRGGHESPVQAVVCLDCGYIEFYASKPDQLKPASTSKRAWREDRVI